jgi:hypothetical protein
MNRLVLGAVAALLLAAAGLFWWQGQAEVERGAPPPAIAGSAQAPDTPIELPSAGAHGRGAAPPRAGPTPEDKEQRRFNRYDRNRDGQINRAEMLSTRVKAFEKLDTNHDNLLSFEEWAVKTSNRFKEIDRNGDGIITRGELDAYYSAKDAKPKADRCACQRKGKPKADSDGEDGEPAQ